MKKAKMMGRNNNMAEINPTVSVITINVDGLNSPH